MLHGKDKTGEPPAKSVVFDLSQKSWKHPIVGRPLSYFPHYRNTSETLYLLAWRSTAVHASIPVSEIKERKNLFCFPKEVEILSASQLLTCSSITLAAFLKYNVYSASLLLRKVLSSNSEFATGSLLRSRSISPIDKTLLKIFEIVPRLPT